MFIPTANVARAAVIQNHASLIPIVNTLWFQKATPFSVADLENLASELEAQWTENVMPSISGSCAFTAIEAVAQDSDTAPSVTHVLSPAVGGGDPTGSDLTTQAALCVTFYTAARGRSGRGRVFLGTFRTGKLQDPHTWSSGVSGALSTGFEELGEGMSSAGFTHVVVSHFHGGVALSSGVARAVTRYAIHNRVDTIRNRLGDQA